MEHPEHHANEAKLEVIRAARTMLGELYPILGFYGLYYGVIRLYDALAPFNTLPTIEQNWIMLSTSPFNFVEAIGKTSEATIQGLTNNFAFPAALMALLMAYNIGVSGRLRRVVSVPSVFGAGVMGTYFTSALVWKFSPSPATGTSIIGFTFMVMIAITAFADVHQLSRVKPNPKKMTKWRLKVVAIVFFLVFGVVETPYAYLLGNPSALLHLFGGGSSIMFLYVWTLLGSPSIPRLPKELGSERSRAIAFGLLVALVVLLS